MKSKFEQLVNDYYNGNLKDFRAGLKKLSKTDLLRFVIYCASDEDLTVFEIEKQFNI